MKYSRYNRGPRKRKFRNDKDAIKCLLKKDYKYNHPVKPDIKSLLEEPRVGDVDEYGESFTEYGFIPDSEDWTEEDIKEWKSEVRRYPTKPWDCSGELCTYWICCHKNPNGLWSYVHHMVVDC